MKISDHRKKYFEDLTVKSVLNRRGRKTYAYVYQGIWYRWGTEGFDLRKRRLCYVFLELLSMAAFAWAGFSSSALNFQKAMAGCGMLSVVALLMELRGVFGFCVSNTYMMETDYKSIDFRLVVGASIRVAIILIGLIIGIGKTVAAGQMDLYSLMTALAYMLTCGVSFCIAWIHHKLGYRNYKSEQGEVGNEC